MRTWSIPAGRFFGVELRIHLTFLFLLLFVMLSESATTGPTGAARGMALVAIIFGSVVLHEFGHAIVAIRSGVQVRGIMLLPIGGVTLMDPQEHMESVRNPARETWISIAGPMVNVFLAGIAALLFTLRPGIDLWSKPSVSATALDRSFFWTNVFMFAFN